MAGLPIVHTSERASVKRCPQQWWWRFRVGLVPKEHQADALWFGIGVHIALAAWYQKGTRRGPHPAETFSNWAGDEIAYAKTYLDDSYDAPVWEDARELGIVMLDAYVDHWGKDPQWHIISTEQPFQVTVKRNGSPIASFRSRWDGVARDEADGQIYLIEHKTASQISTAYLELDDQAGSYLAVASRILRAEGILRRDEEMAGIQYNFLRKARPDTRPQNEAGLRLNKDGSVSKKQPSPLFVRPDPVERGPREQAVQMRRLADEVAVMNALRDGTIPVTKTPTRDCPRCPYWDMCLLHERGGNAWKTLARNSYTLQDPYRDDRKSS